MKINTQFSGWSDVLTGVPRGSILGLLLFNIHICDISFQNNDSDVAKYDGIISYVCCDSSDEVIQSLQDISETLLEYFEGNERKSNPGACHLRVSLNKPVTTTIGFEEISKCGTKNLLSITFHLVIQAYHYSLQTLAVEMFKFFKGVSPKLMAEVFHLQIQLRTI